MTEKSQLIERTYNKKNRTKVNNCLRKMVVGFCVAICFQSVGYSQKTSQVFFELDTAWVLSIPSQLAKETKSLGKISYYDIESKKLFLPLDINNKQCSLSFIELDIQSGKSDLLTFYYPKKIKIKDRVVLSYIRKKNDEIFIRAFGDILVFSKTGKYKRLIQNKTVWDYFDWFEDGSGMQAFYYDHHPLTSREKCGISTMDNQEQFVREIYPPSDFHQLTSFSPNKLITHNSNYVFMASVSEPIIHVYDKQLNLLRDIEVADSTWVYAKDLMEIEEYKTLFNQDPIDFGMKALTDSLSKSLTLSLLNDSTLFYSTCRSYNNLKDRLFQIKKNGDLELIKEHTYGSGDFWRWEDEKFDIKVEKKEVEFYKQNCKGYIADNKLFYIELGPSRPLYEGSHRQFSHTGYGDNIDVNTAFIHVYIFNLIQ